MIPLSTRRGAVLSLTLALGLSGLACVEGGEDSDTAQLNTGEQDSLVRPDGAAPIHDTGPVAAPYTPEPIRVFVKVHAEDLYAESQRTWNPSTGFGPMIDSRIGLVQELIAVADAHGLELSIQANGDWIQEAAASGYGPTLGGWMRSGHRLAPHLHSIAKVGGQSDAWEPIDVTDSGEVWRSWNDHMTVFHTTFPSGVFRFATPFGNNGGDIPDLMAKYSLEAIGGGERNEVSEIWFGHYPFHAWRFDKGDQWLEESPTGTALILPSLPQLDRVSSHGGMGQRTFIDRSVGHLKVRFIQQYAAWLEAERTRDPARRIMHFGVVVHDNQERETIGATLDEFLTWLETNFVGQTSGRGNLIAEYSSFGDIVTDVQAWYDAHPGESHFDVPTPTGGQGGDPVAAEDARAVYPYPHWGLAVNLAAPEDKVVNHLEELGVFKSQGVIVHRLEVGPRDADSVATTSAPRDVWLLMRDTDGSATVDLTRLYNAKSWQVIDGASGDATEILDGRVEVESTPLLVEPEKVRVIFTLNSHDWVFEEHGQELTAWLVEQHERYLVPIDIYLTDPVLQRLPGSLTDALAQSPEVSLSYFFRPPAPFYSSDDGYFDADWVNSVKADVSAGRTTWEAALTPWVDQATDLRYGTTKSATGGIALMRELGMAPVGSAGAAGQTDIDLALRDLYEDRAVRFVAAKQPKSLGEQPTDSGLYWRPEHASIRLWEENRGFDYTDQAKLENHVAGLLDTVVADGRNTACGTGVSDCPGIVYVAVKMHDNDFYADGTPFGPVYNCQDTEPCDPPWTIMGAESLTTLKSEDQQRRARVVWEEVVRQVAADRNRFEPVNLETLSGELD